MKAVSGSTRPGRRRTAWRYLFLALIVLLILGGVALVVYLQPYQASDEARAALHSTPAFTVREDNTAIAFLPRQPARVGLIFYPGAKVEPAAYALTMSQLAADGYATFIVKVPVNFAILDENAAAPVISAYPQIKTWVVGGHSLGGVAACEFARQHPAVKGLLLYASYPASSMVQRKGLTVLSISASNDGLATPSKVNAAKALLPATTTYVVIQGGVHAFFGDYGPQDGDGHPTISRTQARAQIIASSLQLLKEVDTANS